jgi:hypothetical protein
MAVALASTLAFLPSFVVVAPRCPSRAFVALSSQLCTSFAPRFHPAITRCKCTFYFLILLVFFLIHSFFGFFAGFFFSFLSPGFVVAPFVF